MWSSPAVDLETRRVFFGTGSCRTVGKGEESVYALSLDTGELRWSYAAPRNGVRYDDDFGASANLLPGGLVGIGGKDGWYYRFHRRSPPGVSPLVGRTHAGQAGHLSGGFAIGGMIGSAAVGEVAGEPAVFATTAIGTPIGEPYDTHGVDFSVKAFAADTGLLLWTMPLHGPPSSSPAVVGSSVYVGTGTRTTDAEYKATDGATISPLSPTSGVYAFQLAA